MSVELPPAVAAARGTAVKNPWPWYAPRFWHGMRLSTWTGSLLRNRLAISPSRWPMAASITGFSAFNSLLAGMERACFGRAVADVELERPPLFILGHWRSGTTLLHELLIRDPRHAYPTTYQCFAPHHFLLTQRWVTPWSGFLLPARRPMDNMAAGWLHPQEDEFALGNLGAATPYLSMMFPNRGPAFEQYLTLEETSPRERARWQRELKRFFQRLSLHDKRRIVVKSPPHTARIRLLRAMFPNARFVHIARQPESLFASTVALWRSLNELQGLQVVRDDSWLEPYVVRTLQRMYRAYLADRQLLGSGELAEVRYEDLVADPLGELQRIYGQLDLGDFSDARQAVSDYLRDVRNYRVNRHDVDAGQCGRLREAWSDYYEAFGYVPAAGNEAPRSGDATASGDPEALPRPAERR